MLEDLTFKSLGIVNYYETLELMKSHIKKDDFNNEIWLLEHPPIFTLGTAADKNHILNAKDIPIEERNSEELSHVEGVDENNEVKKVLIYPKNSKAMNLAFDVTPAKYVTGLITERGVSKASSEGLKKLFK